MIFHEMEAMAASGYAGLSDWLQETPTNRAKVVAHHIHKNLRESYLAEAGKNEGSKGGGRGTRDGGQSYKDLMGAMGIPV